MALAQLDFYSSVLRQSTRVNVILPEHYVNSENKQGGHPIQKDFPVLYLLHGYNGDETVWMRWSDIERHCKTLPLAVVMVRGEHTFYVDSEYYDYFKFLSEELPEKMKHFFPISTKREDTFIAGLSMGGYGALHAALERPDLYSYAASLAGAVNLAEMLDGDGLSKFVDRIAGDKEAFKKSDDKNLKLLLKKDMDNKAEMPKIFMACGYEDSLLEANREFRDLLESYGLDVHYYEAEGGHHWEFFSEHMPPILKWLPLEKYD